MFEIEDLAFYPNHGIGRIESIDTVKMDERTLCFYVLRILDRDMTVKVPCDRAEALGMRGIIPRGDVSRVYDILRMQCQQDVRRTWNKRFRDYTLKLKSGSPFEIAEVLRDLIRLQASKDLSFGERKMLDQAKTMLIKELAFATEQDEREMTHEIVRIVNGDVAVAIEA
jgi:CarD family transcriptional regulator